MSEPAGPGPEAWARIEAAFREASALPRPPSPRELDAICGGDAGVRREVESLLAAAAGAGDFLEGIARRTGLRRTGDVDAAMPGRRLGAYRLLREIGRGGMGAVYLAERADEAFEKHVAVKLLDPARLDAEARLRFTAERRILARLEHPCIARLLDGGVGDDGTPWFVMEYVAGEPLTAWCAARRLDVASRLKLFLEVCDAVEYAHRNLVVHRDIKPANILVRADGSVVLLDFGIARILDPAAGARRAPLTRAESPPMTLACASPEQLRGEAVSTATDVWALGVLLYELLAGRPPFRLQGLAREAVRRRVCAEAVPPPSGAHAEAADGARPADVRRVRGDLDAIVLRAMAQDPAHRYRSAAALADDIRRHLEARPVTAVAGGPAYRLRKFARRRPGVLAGAGAAAAGALIFVGTLLVYAERLDAERQQAEAERDRARVEAVKAARISGFLTSLFEAADPAVARGGSLTALDLLDNGVMEIRRFDGAPEVRAELLAVLARVHASLGRYGDAEALEEEALAIRRRVLGNGHPDVASSLHSLGSIARSRGDLPRAERYLTGALAMREAALEESDPLLAQSLAAAAGVMTARWHDTPAPEAMLRRALAILETQPEAPEAHTRDALQSLLLLLQRERRTEEADAVRERLARLNVARLQGDDPQAVAARLELAGTLLGRDLDAASEQLRLAFELQQRLGPHPRMAHVLRARAAVAARRGSQEEAETYLRHAWDAARPFRAQDPSAGHAAAHELGLMLQRQGRHEEALPLLREAIALAPPSPQAVGIGLHRRVAHSLAALGDVPGAVRATARAADAYQHSYGGDHPLTGSTLVELAGLLLRQGDTGGADRRSAEAAAMFRRMLADEEGVMSRRARDIAPGSDPAARDSVQLRDIRRSLRAGAAEALGMRATVLEAAGRRDEAIAFAREAMVLWEAAEGFGGPPLPAAPAARSRLERLLRDGDSPRGRLPAPPLDPAAG